MGYFARINYKFFVMRSQGTGTLKKGVNCSLFSPAEFSDHTSISENADNRINDMIIF